MEVTSTEFFMKTSVEASMEDMEDMKASTEVTSTEPFMGAFVNLRGSFHGRYGRYESFRGSNFGLRFYESFHGSSHGINGSFCGSNGSSHGSTNLNPILLPWKLRVRVRVKVWVRVRVRLLPWKLL